MASVIDDFRCLPVVVSWIIGIQLGIIPWMTWHFDNYDVGVFSLGVRKRNVYLNRPLAAATVNNSIVDGWPSKGCMLRATADPLRFHAAGP